MQLARVVAENIVTVDAKFWLRVAARNDMTSSEWLNARHAHLMQDASREALNFQLALSSSSFIAWLQAVMTKRSFESWQNA